MPPDPPPVVGISHEIFGFSAKDSVDVVKNEYGKLFGQSQDIRPHPVGYLRERD
jgi:hypothetical protein